LTGRPRIPHSELRDLAEFTVIFLILVLLGWGIFAAFWRMSPLKGLAFTLSAYVGSYLLTRRVWRTQEAERRR